MRGGHLQLLQALTTTQQMYSTGCNDLFQYSLFWCAHKLISYMKWLCLNLSLPSCEMFYRGLFFKVGQCSILGTSRGRKGRVLESDDGIMRLHILWEWTGDSRWRYLKSHSLSKCMYNLMNSQQHSVTISWLTHIVVNAFSDMNVQRFSNSEM